MYYISGSIHVSVLACVSSTHVHHRSLLLLLLTSHQAMLATSPRKAMREYKERVLLPLLYLGVVEAPRKLSVCNRVGEDKRYDNPEKACDHPIRHALRQSHYHISPQEHTNTLAQHRCLLLPLCGFRDCREKHSSWSAHRVPVVA